MKKDPKNNYFASIEFSKGPFDTIEEALKVKNEMTREVRNNLNALEKSRMKASVFLEEYKPLKKEIKDEQI